MCGFEMTSPFVFASFDELLRKFTKILDNCHFQTFPMTSLRQKLNHK